MNVAPVSVFLFRDPQGSKPQFYTRDPGLQSKKYSRDPGLPMAKIRAGIQGSSQKIELLKKKLKNPPKNKHFFFQTVKKMKINAKIKAGIQGSEGPK